MRIDRGRFLYLAAALGACHATREAPTPIVVAVPAAPAEKLTMASSPPERTDKDVCRTLEPPSSECESFYLVPSLCKLLDRALSDTRGAAVMQCIAAANRSERLCGFAFVDECLGDALAHAKPDPAAEPLCKEAGIACLNRHEDVRPFEWDRCAQAWTLVADDLRESLVACLGEHCSVDACLWGYASIGDESP